MPSVSGKQQRFFGAELARIRSGKKSKTGMSEGKVRDYARKARPKQPNLSDGLKGSY